jgi:DNA-binding transcriptional LysR family regulator
LVDIVAEGYDVVIRVGASDDSFVTSRKIAVVRRGLFVSKSLLKKLGPISTPRDLEKYPAILFEERMPVQPKWIFSQGRSKQSVLIPSATCVNQLDGICTLVRDGLGVAHVPLFLIDSGGKGQELERVLPDWDVVGDIENSAGVFALFSGGPKVSAKVRVFVDHLVSRLSRLQN